MTLEGLEVGVRADEKTLRRASGMKEDMKMERRRVGRCSALYNRYSPISKYCKYITVNKQILRLLF